MIHISMFEHNSKLIIGIIYFLTFHYLDILTIFFLYTQALILFRASTPQFLLRNVQCVFQNIHSRNKPAKRMYRPFNRPRKSIKKSRTLKQRKHQIKRENLGLHVNDRKKHILEEITSYSVELEAKSRVLKLLRPENY